MAICYIIGAMKNTYEFMKTPDDCVIAADGGYQQLTGVKPDLVVGDFDSLGFVPEGERIVKHPVKKDDTDMMLAVKLGLEKGYKDFVLLGGIGGRFDHTFANIQTLAYLKEQGARGFLIGEKETFFLLSEETARFDEKTSGIVSVFSYSPKCEKVTIKGLLYELTEATLTSGFPLGVSNEFVGTKASISIGEGTGLVVAETQLALDQICIMPNS